MTKCTICGKEETLPFICPYCGQKFCVEHRLPESHNCVGLHRALLPPRRVEVLRSSIPTKRMTKVHTPFRIGSTELKHLIIGALVFFLVGASRYFLEPAAPQIILIVFLGVMLTFVLHEVAHKFTAQHYGLWSEFRLDPFGLIISLISIIAPLKIIAPGTVLVFGYHITEKQYGKIALAGPLINLIQAVILAAISPMAPILLYIAILNADLGLFSLIPVAILDGKKIFNWSKRVWVLSSFSAAIVWVFLTLPLLLW